MFAFQVLHRGGGGGGAPGRATSRLQTTPCSRFVQDKMLPNC